MEKRKQEEASYADFKAKIASGEIADASLREYYTANYKFQLIAASSGNHFWKWLKNRVPGKRVLDYGCGRGGTSFRLAELGAKEVVGIDISPASIEICQRQAARRGLVHICSFHVMDAENTTFPDSSFDLIIAQGILHHLDIHKAFPELARLTKPDGRVMCEEALGHNPAIQWYRRHTPHLRTAWETEHILRRKDLDLARRYFGCMEKRFFHLAVLLAVLFRKFPWFRLAIKTLDAVDYILMRLPLIQWQAWVVWFCLSQPVKRFFADES